jgi:hypothetical protein
LGIVPTTLMRWIKDSRKKALIWSLHIAVDVQKRKHRMDEHWEDTGEGGKLNGCLLGLMPSNEYLPDGTAPSIITMPLCISPVP